MAVVKKKIIIHTEQLNRSGYWIKTEGIDISNYSANNVVLNDHEFSQRIGLGVNITKEANGDLTAEIDFNENSELGRNLKSDFENGYVKAASIGILPKKWSREPAYMKEGQSKPTMIESELIEFSLVTIPNNAGAVVFKQGNEGELLKLSIQDLTFDESPVSGSESKQIEHKISDMKKIAILLGLSETASEEEILKKLSDLQGASSKIVDLDTVKKALLSLGAKLGVVTEANKSVYERIANVDLGLALDMVTENLHTPTQSNANPAAQAVQEDVRLTAIVQALKGVAPSAASNDEPKDWDEWQIKNPKGLVEMKAKDWAKFSALYLTKYGSIPPKD